MSFSDKSQVSQRGVVVGLVVGESGSISKGLLSFLSGEQGDSARIPQSRYAASTCKGKARVPWTPFRRNLSAPSACSHRWRVLPIQTGILPTRTTELGWRGPLGSTHCAAFHPVPAAPGLRGGDTPVGAEKLLTALQPCAKPRCDDGGGCAPAGISVPAPARMVCPVPHSVCASHWERCHSRPRPRSLQSSSP